MQCGRGTGEEVEGAIRHSADRRGDVPKRLLQAADIHHIFGVLPGCRAVMRKERPDCV